MCNSISPISTGILTLSAIDNCPSLEIVQGVDFNRNDLKHHVVQNQKRCFFFSTIEKNEIKS